MRKPLVKKRRKLVETILLMLVGTFIALSGLIGMIISIPLMLIIVGFFTFLGSYILLIAGLFMIKNSVYDSTKCHKCFKSINPGHKFVIICVYCKTVTKFKNGRKN